MAKNNNLERAKGFVERLRERYKKAYDSAMEISRDAIAELAKISEDFEPRVRQAIESQREHLKDSLDQVNHALADRAMPASRKAKVKTMTAAPKAGKSRPALKVVASEAASKKVAVKPAAKSKSPTTAGPTRVKTSKTPVTATPAVKAPAAKAPVPAKAAKPAAKSAPVKGEAKAASEAKASAEKTPVKKVRAVKNRIANASEVIMPVEKAAPAPAAPAPAAPKAAKATGKAAKGADKGPSAHAILAERRARLDKVAAKLESKPRPEPKHAPSKDDKPKMKPLPVRQKPQPKAATGTKAIATIAEIKKPVESSKAAKEKPKAAADAGDDAADDGEA